MGNCFQVSRILDGEIGCRSDLSFRSEALAANLQLSKAGLNVNDDF